MGIVIARLWSVKLHTLHGQSGMQQSDLHGHLQRGLRRLMVPVPEQLLPFRLSWSSADFGICKAQGFCSAGLSTTKPRTQNFSLHQVNVLCSKLKREISPGCLTKDRYLEVLWCCMSKIS